MKYRKKPVVIEAIQLLETDESVQETIKFVGEDLIIKEQQSLDLSNPTFYIRTLEGDMKVDFGSYIIKGVQGEFYPCKQDIFEATYERVE